MHEGLLPKGFKMLCITGYCIRIKSFGTLQILEIWFLVQFINTNTHTKSKNEKENVWQNWKVKAMSKFGYTLRITYHYFAYYLDFEKNFNLLMFS